MMSRMSAVFGVPVLAVVSCVAAQRAAPASLRSESIATARILVDTLLKLQIQDSSDADAGAIRCHACGVLHTRAAEAVYPFAVVGGRTGEPRYRRSAVALGNWLIRQQLPDGSWKETP